MSAEELRASIPPVWRVVVAQELERADRERLRAVGAIPVSGHSSPGYFSSSLLVRADDEEAARASIRSALGESVIIREARLTPVFVHAPIPEALRDAFQDAAGEDERIGGVVELEDSGEFETFFVLSADNIDRAIDEARELYNSVCEAAGQPVPSELPMTVSGYEGFFIPVPRDRQLVERAQEFFDAGEYELAVVLAQTACEVLIADAMRSLLQAHVSDEVRPWMLGRTRTFALTDDPTRELFNRITDTKIQEQDWWTGYKDHVKRRHQIVHVGARIERVHAQASLDAADSLYGFVEQTAGSAPPASNAP